MRDEAPRQSDSEPRAEPAPAADASGDGPPPPLNFRILALLWTAVSAGAVWLLMQDPEWARAPGFLAALRAVRLEQWVAVGLLLVHVRWLWGAWRARRNPAAGVGEEFTTEAQRTRRQGGGDG